MPMKLEPVPGGRWYRDLGNNNGHCGRTCRPSSGPRCWRLPGRSCLVLPGREQPPVPAQRKPRRHRHPVPALCVRPHRRRPPQSVSGGWNYILERVRKRAERNDRQALNQLTNPDPNSPRRSDGYDPDRSSRSQNHLHSEAKSKAFLRNLKPRRPSRGDSWSVCPKTS